MRTKYVDVNKRLRARALCPTITITIIPSPGTLTPQESPGRIITLKTRKVGPRGARLCFSLNHAASHNKRCFEIRLSPVCLVHMALATKTAAEAQIRVFTY